MDSPDITYISPTAGLSVPLPPTDVEFSPTGAYAFQRLAIAVGQCIVIYHVNAISVDQANDSSDSPVSSLSESSANTVVRAPTISISAPKSEEDEMGDGDEYPPGLSKDLKAKQELKTKELENSKAAPEKSESKDSVKQPKKTVQFNIDNNASRAGAKSPIPRKHIDIPDPAKIKPSLKQPKPLHEPDDDKTPLADASYDYPGLISNLEPKKSDEYIEGDASVSDETSVPSPIPIKPREDVGELLDLEEEEKAEDADSENSETPAPEAKNESSSSISNNINVPKKRKEPVPVPEPVRIYRSNRDVDQRTFYDDIEEDEVSASTIRQTIPPLTKKLSIFEEAAHPFMNRQDSRSHHRRKAEKHSPDSEKATKPADLEIIKPPEQVAELVKQNEQKPKPKTKKRRHHADENDEHHKAGEEPGSSLSSDSGVTPRSPKKQNDVENVQKKATQKSTTSYQRTGGQISAAIIEVRPLDPDGKLIIPKVQPEKEEESPKVKLITMRQAVLRAGRAQVRMVQ